MRQITESKSVQGILAHIWQQIEEELWYAKDTEHRSRAMKLLNLMPTWLTRASEGAPDESSAAKSEPVLSGRMGSTSQRGRSATHWTADEAPKEGRSAFRASLGQFSRSFAEVSDTDNR
eukprot:Lithocolla_globosa_v1_NODE_27_length_9260_cov_179.654861.p6 type:complete len:119 gc:universal NODE_27_length_9260_cov_179.654861:929-1285(+)